MQPPPAGGTAGEEPQSSREWGRLQQRQAQHDLGHGTTYRDLAGPVESLHPVLQVFLITGLQEVALR